MEIVPANTTDRLRQVRSLLEAYWQSFGFTPCFQNFSQELEGLPGKYAPPEGRLALAIEAGTAAGCVALRHFDPLRCEAKRLYVSPQFRGAGIGHALLDWIIEEARSAGYREMLADTMSVMQQALAMYERRGFERVAPYQSDPAPGAICLRLKLA